MNAQAIHHPEKRSRWPRRKSRRLRGCEALKTQGFLRPIRGEIALRRVHGFRFGGLAAEAEPVATARGSFACAECGAPAFASRRDAKLQVAFQRPKTAWNALRITRRKESDGDDTSICGEWPHNPPGRG